MKQTHAIAAVLVAGLFVGSNALAAATASLAARDTLVAKRPMSLVTSDVAASDEVPEVEIDRNGDALRDEIRPRPTDTDVADTALVFTNQTRHRIEVRCLARNDDGETIGRESDLAEEMLRSDPRAQEILESLVCLSDSIKIDLDSVVAEEDFSGYWDNIQSRLPEGPITGEIAVAGRAANEDVVVRRGRRMTSPSRPWLAWVMGPALGAAAAALVMALFVMPASREEAGPVAAVETRTDHTIDIESIESEGPLVMVMQENSDEPAIIWFVETDAEQEG